MAKKKKSGSEVRTSEKRDLTKFCAFWCLAIAAVLFVVTAVLNLINKLADISSGTLSACISICDIIAKVALLIAIGIPAYGYVRGKKRGWKIFFWIALIIYALGVVFSVISF